MKRRDFIKMLGVSPLLAFDLPKLEEKPKSVLMGIDNGLHYFSYKNPSEFHLISNNLNRYFLAKDMKTKIHFTSGYELENKIIIDKTYNNFQDYRDELSRNDVIIFANIDKLKSPEGFENFFSICQSLNDKIVIVNFPVAKNEKMDFLFGFKEIRKIT